MGGLKTISIIVAANIKGLESGLGKANKSLASFASKSARLGSMMSFGVTAPLVAMGKAAFDTFSNFENSMMKVNTVTGATVEEFKMLTSEAKRLGATTQYTASQVSDLQLVLGRKGFDPTQIKNMEQSILDLALATGEDLSLAAETVSTSINAFGLESTQAARVSNTLASAAANSSIQLSTFATAFGHAGASANAVGVDLERLSAMMGVLMDNGIKASKAGTGLRKIFMKLDQEGRNFTEVLDLATQGEMGLQKAMRLAGVTSANQLLILAKNKDKVAELTKEYKTNTGRLKKMADAMGKTTFARIKKMQSAIEGMKIEMGALIADAITPIIDKVTSLASNFGELDDGTKKMILTFGGIMAAVGPILIGLGALIALVNPLTIGIVALAAAFTALAVSSKKTKSPLKSEQESLNILVTRILGANDSLETRKRLLNELKTLHPDFISNLDDEKTTNEQLKTALDDVNKGYFKKIQLQLEEERVYNALSKQKQAQSNLDKKETNATKKLLELKDKYNISLNDEWSVSENLIKLQSDIKSGVITTPGGGMYGGASGFTETAKLTNAFGDQIEVSTDLREELQTLIEGVQEAENVMSATASEVFNLKKELKETGSAAFDIFSPTISPPVDPVIPGGGEDDVPPGFSWMEGGTLSNYVKEYFAAIKAMEDRTNEFWGGLMESFSSGFSNLFDKQTETVTVMVDGVEEMQERVLSFGDKFGNFVKDFLVGIGKMILKTAVLAALLSIIMPGAAAGGASFMGNFKNLAMGGDMFSGLGFANGGQPPTNQLSLVGENGPELFNPGNTAGTIIPNGAFGGGTTIPDVRITGDDLLIVFDRAKRRKSYR